MQVWVPRWAEQNAEKIIGTARSASLTWPIWPSYGGSPSHYGPIWEAARAVLIIVSALCGPMWGPARTHLSCEDECACVDVGAGVGVSWLPPLTPHRTPHTHTYPHTHPPTPTHTPPHPTPHLKERGHLRHHSAVQHYSPGVPNLLRIRTLLTVHYCGKCIL